MFYKAPEKVITLFNDFSRIASEANYTSSHGKGRPSDLALGFKMFTPKQMFQRLPIARVQVKGNAFENLLNEKHKSYILCIKQEKLLKR